MSGKSKPEFIEPPNTLKDKVSVSPNGVDLDTLDKAEQLIANMQGSYLEWVEEDLRKLQALYGQATQEPERRAAILKDIFAVAHDVKGQGGSFDYHLMTAIGNQLCRYIERIEGAPNDRHMEVVKVHIDAMRLVIGQRMSGDGGDVGENLLRGLEAAIQKTSGPGPSAPPAS